MNATTVSLILGLLGLALNSGPGAWAAISELFAAHAAESPAEAAAITAAVAQRIRDLSLLKDAELDAVDTTKPPVGV